MKVWPGSFESVKVYFQTALRPSTHAAVSSSTSGGQRLASSLET